MGFADVWSESPLLGRSTLTYDVALGTLGCWLTAAAVAGFGSAPTHAAPLNRASGALDEGATVSAAEMMEHLFYQGLLLTQACPDARRCAAPRHCAACALCCCRCAVCGRRSSRLERGSPLPLPPRCLPDCADQRRNVRQAVYLHAVAAVPGDAARCALCLAVTTPWLARHRFPVNSFSANYLRGQPAGAVVPIMYRVKKWQYLAYKHALLHGACPPAVAEMGSWPRSRSGRGCEPPACGSALCGRRLLSWLLS